MRIGNSQFATNLVKWVDARPVRRPNDSFLAESFVINRAGTRASVQIP